MSELFMDVLPTENGPTGTYRVILLARGAGAAAPTIDGITAETLLQRLQDVLQWPKPTIDRLHDQLVKQGRLTNERLESPTRKQLQQLGFNLEGWRGQI
jgi:hypothetical protein